MAVVLALVVVIVVQLVLEVGVAVILGVALADQPALVQALVLVLAIIVIVVVVPAVPRINEDVLGDAQARESRDRDRVGEIEPAGAGGEYQELRVFGIVEGLGQA